MPSCIVENCGNSSYKAAEKGVKLHPFPTQLHRIKQWLQAIPQKFGDLDSFAQQILDAKKTKPHRVCSHHFTPECYIYMSGKIYLSRDAVPSIFSSCDPPPAKKFCMDPSHIGWKEKPACVDVSTRTDIYNFGRDRGTQFDRYYGVKNKKISTEAKSFTRDVATLTDPRLQTSEPQMSTWGKKLKIITPRLNTADKYSQCPEYDFYRSQSRLFNVSPSYKDLMAMSEELAHTGMKGNKDKNQRNEKILNLTLEIIYLLTGEDFMVMKRTSDGFPQNCTDCMLEGPCRRHTPTVAFSSDSVTNDKVVLELMSNIIQLLTGEEWDYIKGKKVEPQQFLSINIESGLEATLYNNEPSNIVAVEEADFCEQGNLTNPENSLIQWDTPTNVIKEEVASCKKRDQSDCSINPFTEPIQGKDTPTPIMGCRLNNSLTDNYILNGINEQSTSWEGGNQSDCRINPLTEHIQRTDTPTPIMGCSLAEDYISLAIKEEAVSWEGRNQSDCSINPLKEQKQGTDTPTPIMGCSSNDIPSVNYMLDAIKEEPTSSEGEDHFDYRIITVSDELQESDVPSPVMGGSLNNSLSSDSALNTIKGEGTSHEEENHLDYTIITISDQMHGADSFTAFSQTNDLPGYNITNQSPTALKLIYKCTVCNRSFDSKRGAVRHHKRSHELEKKFSCSECGKCFTDRSALKTHFKIHTGEKPYSCSECGKSFLYNKDLKIHYRIHTGEKPFSCTECGKHFAYSSDLKIHWRLHTGDKPFSCSECGKCFTHRSGLKSHERYHTGDKYSCAECGKCFVHGSQLKRHLRIHTGEKPFACSECDKCFYNSFELNRHFRIHTGEKPFTCPVCGHCFARRSHLTRHLKCHKGYLASPLEEGNTSYSACPSQEVTEATMEQ